MGGSSPSGAGYPSEGGGEQPSTAISGAVSDTPPPGRVDLHRPSVAASEHIPTPRRVAGKAPTPMSKGQHVSSRSDLGDRFTAWFLRESGRDILIRSGQAIGGRKWEDVAAEGAAHIFAQWADPAKREKFRNEPGYVYKVVFNRYMDFLKVKSRHDERELALPTDDVNVDSRHVQSGVVDPGWEVRHAINLLGEDERELIFLYYFMPLKLSETARRMGLKRSHADRLHKKALGDLKALLAQEDEG